MSQNSRDAKMGIVQEATRARSSLSDLVVQFKKFRGHNVKMQGTSIRLFIQHTYTMSYDPGSYCAFLHVGQCSVVRWQ